MLALLGALADEATQAPLKSQWAEEAVNYLPEDVREQFMGCQGMQDVINVVMPFMDSTLQHRYTVLIQNPSKRQWIMAAVNSLKNNIRAALANSQPKGAVSASEIDSEDDEDTSPYEEEEENAEDIAVEQPENF